MLVRRQKQLTLLRAVDAGNRRDTVFVAMNHLGQCFVWKLSSLFSHFSLELKTNALCIVSLVGGNVNGMYYDCEDILRITSRVFTTTYCNP